MKLTKFEHSCLDIKDGSDRLIIDPGLYSASLSDFKNITVVVITHIHGDHFDPEKIANIITANPQLKIFTTQEVADELKSALVTVPKNQKPYAVGAFRLEFFGDQHDVVSPNFPRAQNFGVLINDKLYDPGDSTTPCPKPHTTLALPTMAPWLKFSETEEFLPTSSAKTFFSTHNGFINQAGQTMYDHFFSGLAKDTGKTYQFLAPGQSIEI
jgi:hypothetical protein